LDIGVEGRGKSAWLQCALSKREAIMRAKIRRLKDRIRALLPVVAIPIAAS
jgi:hypothetical protein